MCKAGLEGSRETVPCDSIGGYNLNVMQAKSFKGSSGPQSVPANLSRMDWETFPAGYRMDQRRAELTTNAPRIMGGVEATRDILSYSSHGGLCSLTA